jgi:hypothetical protein
MGMEKRANERFPDESMVELGGCLDKKGRLVDLSVAGLRVKFKGKQGLDGEREYAIRVQPAKAPDLRPFSLIVKLAWCDQDGEHTVAGFRIVASPSGDEFQHYIDFISYRNGAQNHAD